MATTHKGHILGSFECPLYTGLTVPATLYLDP